ncbi:MAG TPA: GtrA family protein [Rhizomicrobium sp.]|nr:GtrA family protein [Rhizomicrobium sp.]
MPEHRSRQIFLYLLIGGATALVYVAVCVSLVRAGVPTGLASVAGYLLVVPPAYLGQKIFTFHSPALHRIALPKYLALQTTGNIAGYFLSERLVLAGTPAWAAFSAVAIMVAGTNFLAMKYWAFRAHA